MCAAYICVAVYVCILLMAIADKSRILGGEGQASHDTVHFLFLAGTFMFNNFFTDNLVISRLLLIV